MANNVHKQDVGSHKVGSHCRVCGGLRSRTLEEIADFWKTWSECDRPIERAVTWAHVKANIVMRWQLLIPTTVTVEHKARSSALSNPIAAAANNLARP